MDQARQSGLNCYCVSYQVGGRAESDQAVPPPSTPSASRVTRRRLLVRSSSHGSKLSL